MRSNKRVVARKKEECKAMTVVFCNDQTFVTYLLDRTLKIHDSPLMNKLFLTDLILVPSAFTFNRRTKVATLDTTDFNYISRILNSSIACKATRYIGDSCTLGMM